LLQKSLKYTSLINRKRNSIKKTGSKEEKKLIYSFITVSDARTYDMAMRQKKSFNKIIKNDVNKVIKMCLIHDFGEAITGDIPAFLKTPQNELNEDAAVTKPLSVLPDDAQTELQSLFDEMNKRETSESKLFKSLDNLEALISHNEADISTWLPREYDENLTYGQENCGWSDWVKVLKAETKKTALKKSNLNPTFLRTKDNCFVAKNVFILNCCDFGKFVI